MREVRGGDEISAGGGAGVRRIIAVQREPVAELPTRAPNEIGTGAAALELDPGAHALILPLEQRAVAVRDVHHPGHDDRRIAPAGSA